jgi:hypothetical protein
MKEEFAGQLSRVMWDGTDLQLQTEIRYKPESRLLVIFVADGVVVSRVEKPWPKDSNVTREHTRIREFHERLTIALQRLQEKAYIELDELKKVAVRLVSAAMRVEGPKNRADDALSLIPGSTWVGILDKNSLSLEEAPSDLHKSDWINPILSVVAISNRISTLFAAGEVTDICMKTADGFVIAGENENEVLIALSKTETMPVARQMVTRLKQTLLK